MTFTLDDIKKSMPREKARKDSIWVKLWVRPISYPLSWLALRLGIMPNQISVVAIIDALLSAVFLSVNNSLFIIGGLLLLNLFIVFDCMDGTMARTLKKASYMGEFYDAMGGYAMCGFSLLGTGICAFNSGRNLFFDNGVYLIVFGALGSICDIFARLVYQKYTANVMIGNYKLGKPLLRENDSFYSGEKQKKINITYLRLEIDRQFGVGGIFPPLLLLSYIFSFIDVIIILYGLYHLLAFVFAMFLFCRKASKFDAEKANFVLGKEN